MEHHTTVELGMEVRERWSLLLVERAYYYDTKQNGWALTYVKFGCRHKDHKEAFSVTLRTFVSSSTTDTV